MDGCSAIYGCHLLGLIKHMPDICEVSISKCINHSVNKVRVTRSSIMY